MAVKIYDKASDDLLASPVEAVQASRAQALPEQRLFRCHVHTQRAGAFPLDALHRPTGDDAVSRTLAFALVVVVHTASTSFAREVE